MEATPATDATLLNVKNSLPKLKRLYPSKGNRGMYAQPDYNPNPARSNDIVTTFAYDTDNYKSSTTTCFKKSFESYRILAEPCFISSDTEFIILMEILIITGEIIQELKRIAGKKDMLLSLPFLTEAFLT